MFDNLTIKHNANFDCDAVSFDIGEGFMSNMWAMFGPGRNYVTKPSDTFQVFMSDGEEDIYLSLDAGEASIHLCMENQRCWINLPTEQDAEDGTTMLPVESNWIRFVPIMRWLKELATPASIHPTAH